MRNLGIWRALLASRLIGATIAIPHSGNWSLWSNSLMGRQIDPDFDMDLSSIRRLGAVGDSYFAGIGAGNRLGIPSLFTQSDYACSRYDGSYPQLVKDDDRLKGSSGEAPFEFRSCSDPVVDDMLSKQIPYTTAHQDAILLSVGGNNAELSKILNACVFQWIHITGFQKIFIELDFEGLVKKGADKFESWFGFRPKGWDLDKISRSCDEQLSRTERIINGDDYNHKLDWVISATKETLAPWGRIYWTGYAKFFGTEYTPECDSVSWTTWVHSLYKGSSTELAVLGAEFG
ncbi:hypothetical protein QBC38DRAFT_429861 [Podospora fimiseda]|uniref:SGNH hydrolase-type esterase domain-containing protein n=1 Tax=Podospora fimiseda TaxID=252190 RepID=A0AAN6YRC3_9PEZI|nr:hypothetical protein QBC38DRAFT_429861 [Podospora fimiseda]